MANYTPCSAACERAFQRFCEADKRQKEAEARLAEARKRHKEAMEKTLAAWEEKKKRMAEEAARYKEEEDEAFQGIDREKEKKRLLRVLEGLYTRRDRMLYVYGCMDGVRDTVEKRTAMAKLEKTKAWRGLQFDIQYTEKRLDMLKGE